ncbi:hypothetical protein JCGZ_25139 [Jatropha curcas]|uniref:Uncharacterized protein n=1 Tax=Jatropha curcas TaxID=180498 RepID=A0A067JXY5_JATCU|nr:hypothetical protein JCGZ_25139 [Jatropha curcas]
MARGRVFHSDASGSDSHGGRGPGRRRDYPSFFVRYVWGFILCSATSTAAITSFCSFRSNPRFWTSTVATSCTVTCCARRSETGGDGAGPSRRTGGSISAIETARLLAGKLGREPIPIEVFTYTHMKDHDLNTFIDRRAVSVNENYTTARERLVYSQTDESEAESRIDEVAVFVPPPSDPKNVSLFVF